MQTPPESGGAVPRGICESCLEGLKVRRVPLATGGQLLAAYCEHNRCGGVIEQRPDGALSSWRLQVPCSQDELRALVALLAGAHQGLADADQARLAAMN